MSAYGNWMDLLAVPCTEPVPPTDLHIGASSGCSQSLFTRPALSQFKLNQQKAVASVTAGVYQKDPGSTECISVMC